MREPEDSGAANSSSRGWPSSSDSLGECQIPGEPEASASVWLDAAAPPEETEADGAGAPSWDAIAPRDKEEADGAGSAVLAVAASKFVTAGAGSCHCQGPSKLDFRGARPSESAARRKVRVEMPQSRAWRNNSREAIGPSAKALKSQRAACSRS